jgi:dihydrolipoamide dehydrogenase
MRCIDPARTCIGPDDPSMNRSVPNAAAVREADVVVLGAGTAGLAAYRAAAAETPRVLLIEAGAYGTTCARVGCMPSKLLIAAAETVHHAQHAEPFGVHVPRVEIDGRAVLDRVKRERDRFVGFVVDGVETIPGNHKLRGRARFTRGADMLEVTLDGVETALSIHARAVVIATGSSAVLPPMLEGLGDRLVINDHVFDWDTLPASVAVFGTGVVGLEIGQALHRLGVRVRIFGRGGSIGPLTDRALRDVASGIFAAELAIHPHAAVRAVRREEAGVAIDFDDHGAARTETFEYVLAATGRSPNVAGLGLENTGITLDARGVPLFDRRTLQCGVSSIFIAGDATHDVPLLHEAADEGKIAGLNAARFPDVSPGHRRTPLGIMFTDPQVATLGASCAELTARMVRGEVIVGEVSFEDQGRSRVMLQNQGLLHVYAERGTGRLLGAEMICPRAEHLGHLLAWSHQMGMTVPQMLEMPFYHPVIEEGLRTALRDAASKLARVTAPSGAAGTSEVTSESTRA